MPEIWTLEEAEGSGGSFTSADAVLASYISALSVHLKEKDQNMKQWQYVPWTEIKERIA